MAQTRPSSIAIQAAFDNQVSRIYSALKNAFKAEGYSQLFEDFWGSISPAIFPCDDLASINAYYLKHPQRILTILESHGCQNMTSDKKLLLKLLSDLCHSLVRIKYVLNKVTLLSNSDVFSSACHTVHTRLTEQITLRPVDERDATREMELLDNYFYLAGTHLTAVGYLKSDLLFNKRKADQPGLPSALQAALLSLKGNGALNELIEPLEAAKKAGGKTAEYYEAINAEIIVMQHASRELAAHSDAILLKFAKAIDQMNAEAARLANIVTPLLGDEFIFILASLLEGLQDERSCSSLHNAIQAVSTRSLTLCSYVSTATMGMISDPWRDVDTAVKELAAFNASFYRYLDTYTGGVNLLALHKQYTQFKQKIEKFHCTSARMQQMFDAAKQTNLEYQQAITLTISILNDHVKPIENDSTLSFVGRHWVKMFAGGATGGSAAVAVLFLSTNPVLLAGCVAGGFILGAAGGTGGGLIHDRIDERRAKIRAENARLPSYGTLWQSKPAAAVVISSPSKVVLKR